MLFRSLWSITNRFIKYLVTPATLHFLFNSAIQLVRWMGYTKHLGGHYKRRFPSLFWRLYNIVTMKLVASLGHFQRCQIWNREYCLLNHFNPGLGTTFFPIQNVPFFPALIKNVLFFPVLFFEFLATYETQKNVPFFPFFSKERKRTQRTERSFAKNGKECENVSFFCKRTRERSLLFSLYT